MDRDGLTHERERFIDRNDGGEAPLVAIVTKTVWCGQRFTGNMRVRPALRTRGLAPVSRECSE